MSIAFARVTVVVLGALTLSACGGGGGSDDSTFVPPPPSPGTYTIGGTITGLQDNTTVVLQNNGSNTLSRTQNGAFTFTTGLAPGAAYNVTVSTQPTAQSCTVSSGSGTVGSANVSSVNVLCTPQVAKFVYVTSVDSSTISAYSINASTGALTAVAGSPFATPSPPTGRLVSDPAGKALYATVPSTFNAGARLAAFEIDSTSGALTQNPLSPFGLSPTAPINDQFIPYTPLVHRSGQFIYVGVLSGTEYGLAVQSNGSLLATPGQLSLGFNLRPGVFDSAGKFLYLPYEVSSFPDLLPVGKVGVFEINQTTGALVTAGPFDTGALRPIAAALTASGKFLLITHGFSSGGTDTSGLVVMSVDAQSGALTQVAGSPFASGSQPTGIVTHPTKNLVYVRNGSGLSSTISAYQIDATTGVLTTVAGSPFPVRTDGSFFSGIEPSGRFLYMLFTNGVDAYAIDQTTGALTPVTGMPLVAESAVAIATMDPSGRYFYVSNSISGNQVNTIATYAVDPLTGVLKEVNRVPTGPRPSTPATAGRQ